ncbi:hypothetical protein BaRGS_00032022, partial [Batillaria attramentaria]
MKWTATRQYQAPSLQRTEFPSRLQPNLDMLWSTGPFKPGFNNGKGIGHGLCPQRNAQGVHDPSNNLQPPTRQPTCYVSDLGLNLTHWPKTFPPFRVFTSASRLRLEQHATTVLASSQPYIHHLKRDASQEPWESFAGEQTDKNSVSSA